MKQLPNFRYNRSLRARCEANSIHVKSLVERNYEFPDWQRKSVWSDKNCHKLIGALINGRPFPEIFIWQDTRDNTDLAVEENVEYVNEGQQRVRTIMGFVKNEYAVPSEYFKPVLVFEKPCNLFFSDLPEEIQLEILYTKVSIVEMANMSQEAAILHFIEGGENVKPLSRPELVNAYISSRVHQLCYKELLKTGAFDLTAIPPKRFGFEEQYTFLFQMVVTRFRVASPPKHLKELFNKYHKDNFTQDEFDALDQVKRTKKLVNDIKIVTTFMENSHLIRAEQLHLLATFLHDADPIEEHLPTVALWYEQFLRDLKSATTDSAANWTPWFSQAAKTFYSIPALVVRLNFMKEHYRNWIEKTTT